MKKLIACNVGSYGKYAERAWTHLPQIGINHVEVRVPTTDQDKKDLRKRLDESGLTVSSFLGSCDVKSDDLAALIEPQIATCRQFGARILFVSATAGDTDRNLIWQRLRAAGDVAAQGGVKIAMETHPDLMANGDVGRQTMESVKHPNVQVNFDTANIHYYNQGIDGAEELKKVLEHVASVHLKDTTGKYRTWDFPALGTGIVDFAKIFSILSERGFSGPYTMELEGTEGKTFSETERIAYVADSVAHLKSIGALG
jgi:inosose dehydratase